MPSTDIYTLDYRGRSNLKTSDEGCALCGATWGNVWANFDGDRLFFCCDLCVTQFRNMTDEVKRRTGWNVIDEIKVTGDYTGRKCVALAGGDSYDFFIRFGTKGEIESFNTA